MAVVDTLPPCRPSPWSPALRCLTWMTTARRCARRWPSSISKHAPRSGTTRWSIGPPSTPSWCGPPGTTCRAAKLSSPGPKVSSPGLQPAAGAPAQHRQAVPGRSGGGRRTHSPDYLAASGPSAARLGRPGREAGNLGGLQGHRPLHRRAGRGAGPGRAAVGRGAGGDGAALPGGHRARGGDRADVLRRALQPRHLQVGDAGARAGAGVGLVPGGAHRAPRGQRGAASRWRGPGWPRSTPASCSTPASTWCRGRTGSRGCWRWSCASLRCSWATRPAPRRGSPRRSGGRLDETSRMEVEDLGHLEAALGPSAAAPGDETRLSGAAEWGYAWSRRPNLQLVAQLVGP